MDVNTVIKHITYNLMYRIKIFKPFTIEKSPFYKTSFQLPFEKIGWNPSSIHSSSFTFQLVSLSSRSTWYARIKMAKLARCSSITFLTFYIWKLRCVSSGSFPPKIKQEDYTMKWNNDYFRSNCDVMWNAFEKATSLRIKPFQVNTWNTLAKI